MKKILKIFIFLLLTAHAYAIEFSVKTVYKEKTEDNVSVFLFNAEETIDWKKPSAQSLTDSSGRANFSVLEGRYYILAKKDLKDSQLFGFYGLNPINIRTDQTISVTLLKYREGFAKKIKQSRLEGTVYFEGEPVENVAVYVYLDLSSELKGPPYQYGLTDKKGYFSLDIEEGSYYLVFRKRSGSQFGPPVPGDLIGFFPILPLRVEKGGYRINAHIFQIPEKRDLSENRNVFKVKGRILFKDGKAAEGYYVGLYDNRELLGKPIYVSNPTDSNGKFTIFVKQTGEFYLGVRSRLGDTPDSAERVFYYDRISIRNDYKEQFIEIRLD